MDVLIVERDALNRRFLADALQANGYATIVARDLVEAGRALKSQSIKLVLIEPQPSDEGDMSKLGRVLALGSNDVPIIAVTSGSTAALAATNYADTLSKPIRLEKILKFIERKIGPGHGTILGR